MLILKEEINDTLATALELVKWKLIVLATVTAAGLGVLKDVAQFKYGYLLLFFSPFVCLYVDLLIYERVARVHYIARYLRDYSGKDAECKELGRWERYIDEWRKSALWLPAEGTARFASSLVASSCIPLLAFFVDDYYAKIMANRWVITIPAVGFILVVLLYWRQWWLDKKFSQSVPPPQSEPAQEQVGAPK